MEARHVSVLELLATVRLWLREAEANTVDLSKKLQFLHDDSDGWPVLRLKGVAPEGDAGSDAPWLKVMANDRCEIAIHSSMRQESCIFKCDADTVVDELHTALAEDIAAFLDWTLGTAAAKTEEADDLFTDEIEPSREELFVSADEVSDEELEALPDIF